MIWHTNCIILSSYNNSIYFNVKEEDKTMKWETPEYSDIRFGFEVTMYINNK